MAKSPRIVMGALNISADPHPPGIYRRIFTEVAGVKQQIHGADWGKITEPQDRETTPPSFYGRVLLWTEIDRDGKWLHQEQDREATPTEKRNIVIPNELDPNFRSFHFVFFEDRHLLVVEFQNELGERFGAARARKLFSLLLNRDDQDWPEVSVTVVPSQEALEKIYAIPRLRKLELYVIRPNPDDLTTETARVLDRLVKQGAKDQTLVYTKRAKVKSITPDEETKTLAEVAANNGYVSGEGKDEDGAPVMESTKDHPKTFALDVEGAAPLATFYAHLSLF